MVDIKKILFPCDLTENSKKIMTHVLSLAEKYESEVFILHVVRNLQDWGELYVPYFTLEFDQKRLRDSGEKSLNELFKAELDTTTKIHKQIVIGDAADEILKTVESENIDLVVMGTHGRKGLKQTIFGSVANEVVRNASVPVMVINPYR